MSHPVRHLWTGLLYIAAAGVLVLLLQKFAAASWDEITAAWVQAIGSIGAIIGAAWFTDRQINADRVARREEVLERRRERLGVVVELAKLALIATEEKAPNPQDYLVWHHDGAVDLNVLTRLSGAMELIPLHELGDGAVSLGFLNLRRELVSLDGYYNSMGNALIEESEGTGPGPEKENWERFEALRQGVRGYAERLLARIAALTG